MATIKICDICGKKMDRGKFGMFGARSIKFNITGWIYGSYWDRNRRHYEICSECYDKKLKPILKNANYADEQEKKEEDGENPYADHDIMTEGG